MAVHQLIPTFSIGDATGLSAVHLQLLLRRLGIFGELFAAEVPTQLTSLVKPVSMLKPSPEDLVLYHHGIGSWLSGHLIHLPCRRGVVFHNISPVRVYRGAVMEHALISGRAQLAAMAPHVELAIGDSDFNSRELIAAGHSNVHTVPLFIEPERFRAECADAQMRAELDGPGSAVVFVSRVMPHKRFEDLLALHAERLRLDSRARLFLVGGYEPGGAYFRMLHKTARGMPGVRFLGRLSHAQLVSAYRSASVFVSMSEHEGFGVPLLEAMACELPVLAYAAAAVPETLGGAGIAFTQKHFAALAELTSEVERSSELRKKLVEGQKRRLQELDAGNAPKKLARALGSVLPRHKVAASKKNGRPANPRVAFVIHRYGDVSGGAELLCRQLARQLSGSWNITVLTTCAKDHLTWENEFAEGEERDGGVRVLRFPTTKPRDIRAFNALSRRVFTDANDRPTEEHWAAEQGPLAPGLLKHLDEHAGAYDGFIFFTYLYTSTLWGLPMVKNRSLLVSTAHDEPPLRLGLYPETFAWPKALICLTPEEKELIERQFPHHAPIHVASLGIESAPGDERLFRQRYGIEGPYLFYVGRIEAGKGIPELLKYHRRLVQSSESSPELVLAGASSMRVGQAKVRTLGRITEEEKRGALAGAIAAVAPSRYESLSLLALEAFSQGTPVLANGNSEVLTGQIRRSGGGLTYVDAESFAEGVWQVQRDRTAFGEKGLAFAKKHTWQRVLKVYRSLMKPILEMQR